MKQEESARQTMASDIAFNIFQNVDVMETRNQKRFPRLKSMKKEIELMVTFSYSNIKTMRHSWQSNSFF